VDGAQDEDNEFPKAERCLMIFRGSQVHESRRQRHINKQEVNVVHTLTTPTQIRWSQAAITFNQEDHPDRVPHPGRYPLVVSLIVDTTHLTKVLMDGGSGLNILYDSTLDKMGIPQSSLCPSRASFYGIMPGKEAMPLGRI
jgi:hypothetical protein